jgi:hypothetical protein
MEEMDPSRPSVKGRVVEVDICESDIGFVMSVGVVSVWLAPAVAIDVLETLAGAVAAREAREGESGLARSLRVLRRTPS